MSGRNTYAEIATHYRRLITDGTLAPGDPMPSMRQVCEKFGVSMATANRAFALLMGEGLTTPSPGIGTLVTERPRVASSASARLARISRTGKPYGYKEKSIKHTAQLLSCADPIIAEQLGVELHDEVVVRSRVFVVDDTPTVVATSCIHVRALSVVPELLNPEPLPRFWQKDYMERTGREITKLPERRSARQASNSELDAFGITAPPDVAVPVLVLINSFHDEDGPLEAWEDVWRPGLWQADEE